MADIPGLIEGAHAGAGLGHEFLRHIERTGILVHLVEPEPQDGSDPLANHRTIRGELERYSVDLAARQEITVVTKADLPRAEEVRNQLVPAAGPRRVVDFGGYRPRPESVGGRSRIGVAADGRELVGRSCSTPHLSSLSTLATRGSSLAASANCR